MRGYPEIAIEPDQMRKGHCASVAAIQGNVPPRWLALKLDFVVFKAFRADLFWSEVIQSAENVSPRLVKAHTFLIGARRDTKLSSAAWERISVGTSCDGKGRYGRKDQEKQHNFCFQCVHGVSFLGSKSGNSVNAVSGEAGERKRRDLRAAGFRKT